MNRNRPVDDSLFVKEFESEQDFCRVESCSVEIESRALLNVEHQVAAVQVLHHEEQVRLKTNKERNQWCSQELSLGGALGN